MRRLCTIAAAVLALLTTTGALPAAAADQADSVETYKRDVFVIVGSTLRHPDATTPRSAPLFNVAGVNLGQTWGNWLDTRATSTFRVTSTTPRETDIQLTFSGLKPSAVYSVFYVTLLPDSENPACPGVERALPIRSVNAEQRPDFASFRSGRYGKASFHGRAPGNLLRAQEVYVQLIYHFDGKTYGSLPNKGEFLTQGPSCRSSYGEDAFRQVLITQKR